MYLLNRFAKAISLGAILVSVANASGNPRINVRPQARIAKKIDSSKVVTIANSHSAKASLYPDLGRVAANTQLHNITLVLKSSDAQEHALAMLIDQQQDKAHSNFHQWLTPQAFGAAFGVDPSDIAQVASWLKSNGLSVDKIANSGRSIQFSGASGKVEAAFHTEMHVFSVGGEKHISNSTDIAIPEALSPVVRGVARLNNFRPSTSAVTPAIGARESDGTMHSVLTPNYTNPAAPVSGTASAHYVGGADYAAIYDTAPLLAKGVNGTGVSIGLVETSDVQLSDVALYRNIFGLPVNQPTIVHPGPDSGLLTLDDNVSNADVIGAMDAEVSGALAPFANIVYVASGYSPFDLFGVDNSAFYLVDNNVTDIISMNSGVDETDATTGLNGAYEAPNGDVQLFQMLWEQAAAQGQSVFVTSGSGGPDMADFFSDEDTGAAPAYGGTYSVNAYASTAYNVAVGSTEFNEGTSTYASTGATSFWGPTPTAPPYASALGYIPENAWNQSKYGTINGAAIAGAANMYSSGGGVSAYSQLPSWQNYPNISLTTDPQPPAGFGAFASNYLTTTPGPHRLLPDVALASGDLHDGTIICYEGSCTLTSAGQLSGFGLVSGASASVASMAGIQALINQANGGRQGNPNVYYYKIASAQSAANCNSSTYPLSGGSCAFHDITVGNTDIPAAKTGTTEIGWNAGAGFDLTTGLGSPDAYNLANQWNSVYFSPTSVGLNISDNTNYSAQTNPLVISHGDNLQVGINVYPIDASGNPISGTPTGDVALIAQSTTQGSVGFYNITNLCSTYASSSATPAITAAAASAGINTGSQYEYTITFTSSVAGIISTGQFVTLTGLTGSYASLNGYQTVTAVNANGFQIQVSSPTALTFTGSSTGTAYPNSLVPITAAALTATAGSATNGYLYSITFTGNIPAGVAAAITAGTQVTLSGLTGSYAGLNGTQAVSASTGTSFTILVASLTTLTFTGTTTGTASPVAAFVQGTPIACGGIPGDGNTFDTLNNGNEQQSGNLYGLPGGTYNVYAHYTGDTVYAASNSQMVPVTVSPEVTTLAITTEVLATAGTVTLPPLTPTTNYFTYGQSVYIDAYPVGNTGTGTPTGTVTFNLTNSSGTALTPVTATLNSYDDSFFLAGNGSSAYFVVPNYPSGFLPVGTYNVATTYSGDASFVGSAAPLFSITVGPAVSKPGLTVETADIKSGGQPTFAASVANAATAQFQGYPSTVLATGTMAFVDTTTNTSLGSCAITSGACVFTPAAGLITTTGAHTITETFTDTDGNYTSGTTKTGTVTVVAGTASTTVLSPPVGIQVGGTASIAVTLTPATAAGTVAFYANGIAIGTATATAGKATGSITNLNAGTYSISATYGGSATVDASATTTSVNLTVAANTTSLALTAQPTGDTGSGYAMQAVLKTSPNTLGKTTLPTPAPNPVVNFYQGSGTTPICTANLVIDPSTLNYLANCVSATVTPGPSTIKATFVGDTNYLPASATETVNLGLTTLAVNVSSPSLSSANPNLGTGESITLKAIVTPSVATSTTVGGTVIFSDNGVPLGTTASLVTTAATALTNTGVATLTTTLPTTSATHVITAVYAGDTHFYTSTSALSYNITSLTPAFTIAVTPGTLSLAPGSTGSVSVTATVTGNWTGQAPLVCTGLPTNSFCTFSYTPNAPSTSGVPLSYFTLPGANGSGYTGTLTITTVVPHIAKSGNAAGFLWLPALFFAGLFGLRRRQLTHRGQQLLTFAILLCGTLAITACGTSTSNATPTGSSTVTVIANGVGSTSASPNIQPSATFTLTVTQ